MKIKFYFIAGLLLIAAAVIGYRLFQIQYLERENFNNDPTQKSQVNKARFGRVMDRNGIVLWDKLLTKNDDGKEIYSHRHLEGMSAVLRSVVNNKITELRGQDGIVRSTLNKKKGREVAKEIEKDPLINGKDVYLTLDLRIQEIVENAVKKFVPEFGADGASITVMDPRTGQILAFINFNNLTKKYDGVLHAFEPGSIFKPITAVIALESGVDPKEAIDIEMGKWQVSKIAGETAINDSHIPQRCRAEKTCKIDMQEAMVESSNIAFGKYVVEKIGYGKFFDGMGEFGIGQNGSFFPLRISQSELKKVKDPRTQAAQGFGQSIDLTSLDMVKAFSAIANGGTLYNPKLILENGMDSSDTERDSVRRVLTSTENTRLLRNMTKGVLEAGTAKNVRTKYDFFEFAGKTGTAQFLDSTGKYTKNVNNSSFIGMDNASDPHFVCLVTMFNTKKAGATAAGPVFQKIMEQIYLHPALAPKIPQNFAYAPADSICNDVSFLGYLKDAAENRAYAENCPIRFNGNSGAVVAQKIVRDSNSNSVYLELIMRDNQKYTGKMPNVQGLDLVNALGMLEHAKVIYYEGAGRVVEQIPEQGTEIKNGKVILKLREGV